MAAIAHASRVNTTNQTTTSGTYADATNADIAAASLTTGDKYLILAQAQLGCSATSAVGVGVRHGATAFPDSEHLFAPGAADYRTPYFWWTVWTAVSGEDISLQYRSGGTDTAGLDMIVLLAINLSVDVTENTDWFFAELSTDDALTTTFLAGGSVTFTPSVASHDWLVLTNGQFSTSGIVQSCISRMGRSGEASSSLPEARMELEAAANTSTQISLAQVFTLGAASNTFQEEGAESAADATRLHSRVFALDLNKFRNHEFAYTEAAVQLSITDYATELQTLSVTPDVTGPVWTGSYFGGDFNASSLRAIEYRLQRDNADEPAGQTADNYQIDAGRDTTDELAVMHQSLPSLTAATAAVLDLDASVTGGTTATGQQRLIWAVSMELPAGPLTGQAAITELADTVAATGQVALAAAAQITEAADTLSASAQVAIAAAAAITEAAEGVSAEGAVTVVGEAGIQEAADTLEATGVAPSSLGDAAIQEAADTLSSVGQVAVSAAAAINEAADSMLASGAVEVGVFAELQEQADALTSAGEVAIAAAADIQEADDTLQATGLLDAGVLGEAAIVEALEAIAATAEAAISAQGSITEGADAIISATAAAVAGQAAILESPDTVFAEAGEVIYVEPTPAGAPGRRRKKTRRRRQVVEDNDQLYQYAEPTMPEPPPPDPTPPIVHIPAPIVFEPVNLPALALSKSFDIPYFPLRKQQKVPDVRPEKALVPVEQSAKAQAKSDKTRQKRRQMMKAIAVAMMMLEDE